MSDQMMTMSGQLRLAPPVTLPFADRVRVVPATEPFRWLAAGWGDFRRSRGLSVAYSFVFVIAGLWLTAVLAACDLGALILPLGAGFLLIGPALAVGFHAVSRDLEAGREPASNAAWAGWRANPGPLLALGLGLLGLLTVWLIFTGMTFALSFGDAGGDWQRALGGAPFTVGALSFLVPSITAGAMIAAVAFVAGAFSLPLLLERRAGLAEALAISFTAVILNARAMAVWAALIVLFTVAGLAGWYIGLCVTLPVIGHASWHAYRAVIRTPA